MTRTSWLACMSLLLCSAILSVAASAEDQNTQSYELDIDALPLMAAVKSLSDETGIEVLYFTDDAKGVTSAPVKGEFTPQEALETMLVSTNLEVVQLEQDGAVAIRLANDQRGASDLKNLNPEPVLMAQNQTSQATTNSQSSEGGTGIVTGKVTDARTGANLKGAKVTIEETGQWTSTNDLGEFRLVNVPTGSATLTVSFLGYAGQSAVVGVRGDGTSQNFALRGGSEIEEIVVFGQRSARALALNQERTADNVSTVVSSDLLGQFSGTTISDALRHAPGVAFVPNPNTGEGSNIIVRGLEPDLNQVRLNGVRLPEGSGRGRAPGLDTVLTESVEKVTINKTLLPSQDSTGTGGLVEIETKSPLDRPRRFANALVEHTDRGGEYGESLLLSGTMSGTFGNDGDFGASVSVQFRDLDVAKVGYDTGFDPGTVGLGPILPAGETSVGAIDPLRSFPFEPGLDEIYPRFVSTFSDKSSSENITVSTALEKQFGSHTNLRLDLSRTSVDGSTFSRFAATSPNVRYISVPVSELNGEERFVSITERPATGSRPGVLVNQSQSVFYQPDAKSETDIYSFRGESLIDEWRFSYGGGYRRGSNEATTFSFDFRLPRNVFLTALSPNDLTDEVRDNTINDLIVSIYTPLTPGSNPGFIFPGYTQQRIDFVNDASNYEAVGLVEDQLISGENKGLNFDVSARYEFDHPHVRYLEVGVEYIDDEFSSVFPLTIPRYTPAAGLFASDFGLVFGAGILDEAGLANAGFGAFTENSIVRFRNSVPSLVDNGQLIDVSDTVNNAFGNVKTEEESLATYIQGQIDFGKLEVIAGVRFDDVTVGATSVSFPSLFDEFGVFDPTFRDRFTQNVFSEATERTVLPRVLLNYRWSENVVARLGYFTSVARPEIQQLNRLQNASLFLEPIYGPQGDQPQLLISQGNPSFKPASTESYDLSIEWYDQKVGAVKFGAFLKETDNYRNVGIDTLELSDLLGRVDLPDAPEFQDLPDDIFIQLTQPVNGDGTARIWGWEVMFERRFDSLPGFWGGLGVNANYVRTDSEKPTQLFTSSNPDGFIIADLPYDGSPEEAGSFGITYSKNRIDSNLTYSWQERRLLTERNFGLFSYADEIDSLDFSLTYQRDIGESTYRLYVKGNDLLRDDNEATLSTSVGGFHGAPVYEGISRSYFGGRSLTIGLSATF